jgi:UDP-N-acetyl-D-mannosaminuronic acid dehydrogenase
VGGHCIAVDPWFIVSRNPAEARLIRTARETNDAKPAWVLARIDQAVADFLVRHPGRHPSDVTVACWGLAFKPDIDDLRESPALDIVRELSDRHPGPVLAVEPHVAALPKGLSRVEHVELDAALSRADLHVLLVGHAAFRGSEALRKVRPMDMCGAMRRA